MSEEDTKRLMSILEDAGKFSEIIGKVLNAAKILGAIVVLCVCGFVTSILWVNAKATTIDQLVSRANMVDLERKATLKEWTDWKVEIERVLAKLAANQERVIDVQDQQTKLFADHLNASIQKKG
jgi:hypothetical protein